MANVCMRTFRRCIGGAFDDGDGLGIDCCSDAPDNCPHCVEDSPGQNDMDYFRRMAELENLPREKHLLRENEDGGYTCACGCRFVADKIGAAWNQVSVLATPPNELGGIYCPNFQKRI